MRQGERKSVSRFHYGLLYSAWWSVITTPGSCALLRKKEAKELGGTPGVESAAGRTDIEPIDCNHATSRIRQRARGSETPERDIDG